MDISQLISALISGGGGAAGDVVKLVTEEDAAAIAATQYDEEPQKYTGPNAVKLLADDTFGGMKHFLRGKIGPTVDLAFAIGDVRRPLREKANSAAKKEIEANTPV